MAQQHILQLQIDLDENIRYGQIPEIKKTLFKISKLNRDEKLCIFLPNFHGKIWKSISDEKSDVILKIVIKFCIENDIWTPEVKDEQLCRFTYGGTIEQLKVLYKIGGIIEDTKCKTGSVYRNRIALYFSYNNDIKILEFLLKNYTYTLEEIQSSINKCISPEHINLLKQKYQELKALESNVVDNASNTSTSSTNNNNTVTDNAVITSNNDNNRATCDVLCYNIEKYNIQELVKTLFKISKFDHDQKLNIFLPRQNGQPWLSIRNTISDIILKIIINFCIENDVWTPEVKAPQLCRFAHSGTVEQLRVLRDTGHITTDTNCTPCSYNSLALCQSYVNDGTERLEFLLKHYTYTLEQIQCSIDKCRSPEHKKLLEQKYNELKALENPVIVTKIAKTTEQLKCDLDNYIRYLNIPELVCTLFKISKHHRDEKLSIFLPRQNGIPWSTIRHIKSDIILNICVNFCIENDIWTPEVQEPQLCRFARHGTVEQLRVLRDTGNITSDTVCMLDHTYTYSNQIALHQSYAYVNYGTEKLEFLLKNYTYTLEQIQCSIDNCRYPEHRKLLEQKYQELKDIESTQTDVIGQQSVGHTEPAGPAGHVNMDATPTKLVLPVIQNDNNVIQNDQHNDIVIRNDKIIITRNPDGSLKQWIPV